MEIVSEKFTGAVGNMVLNQRFPNSGNRNSSWCKVSLQVLQSLLFVQTSKVLMNIIRGAKNVPTKQRVTVSRKGWGPLV